MNLSHECTHCAAKTQLYLCNRCTTTLRSLLEDLPWLLNELATTIRRQDQLTNGNTIGHTDGDPGPINLTALDTERDTRATLINALNTLTAAPGLPGLRLDHITTPDIARTLAHNVQRIAHHPKAADIYGDINALVADDEIGRAAPLWKAINRQERIFAGPCPTVMGHNQRGEAIHCDTGLYADRDEKLTHCPRCENTIDVAKNRLRAAVDRDLLPEAKLLEVLADLDEKVSRVQLYEWIRTKKIQPRGWIHQGRIVGFRIRRGDPRVFSLSQARALRAKGPAKQPAAK